ncbi:MAG: hypothetical protein EP329_27645 [Deltaproteobacteria bacterium]|nr:MAG: hypothetical protein EP329_27645 [Deltaproteobacteria bacterium]
MSIAEKLEEAVLAYLYGDGEEDPGAIVIEAAADPEADAWLAGLGDELRVYKSAVGAAPDGSDALARLAALREEITRYREREGATERAPSNVISLAARRREKRRTYSFVATFAALAAGILVAVVALQGGPEAPVLRPTVAQAQRWVDELEPGGFGFSGDGPTARDRGFLLGVVGDLSAPHADGTGANAEELAAAGDIALIALLGLDYDRDPAAALQHANAGCAALLKDATEAAECELGRLDYQRKRDAQLKPPEAPR